MPSQNHGITLVEVLAAMLILALGILALAPMMALSVTSSRSSVQITAIAAEAQASIEERIGAGNFGTMPFSETQIVDGKYTITTDVRDDSVDPSIPSRVYEVTVTVLWQDDKEVGRNLSFITYIQKT